VTSDSVADRRSCVSIAVGTLAVSGSETRVRYSWSTTGGPVLDCDAVGLRSHGLRLEDDRAQPGLWDTSLSQHPKQLAAPKGHAADRTRPDGQRGGAARLTRAAAAQTLKRNSTTSPSAIT
jgi:hypothetical protein